MKNKMFNVILFSLSAFLLTSCSMPFGGLFGLFGDDDEEKKATVDDLPVLKSRSAWGKPYHTTEYDGTDMYNLVDNTVKQLYVESKLYLYENGFTTSKAIKELNEHGQNYIEHCAYHGNGETSMYLPSETEDENWSRESNPLLHTYNNFFSEHYITALTLIEDNFIYWYDGFVSETSKSAMAARETSYAALYPNANISITLTTKDNVFYLREIVAPPENSTGDSMQKTQYLEINDGRPTTYRCNTIQRTTEEEINSLVAIYFDYTSPLPTYGGPLYLDEQ